ncbi:helix-turn-helix domain-containing protein [Kitasatospora sp. NBC_01560]|uniref:ArsR/SmtB family transcription factor n=1 Tax=Kitasatospora sp. NBC_01560 TaxID=2975965 RepID=UPI003870D10A
MNPSHAAGDPDAAALPLADHPVRAALLELLGQVEVLTANEAGRRLGQSSGLCSFHLRQLGRAGLIEEVPQQGGRARPWRLRRGAAGAAGASSAGGSPAGAANPESPESPEASESFSCFTRGLEDESYRRWLAERDQAPEEWRLDDAFSSVLYLTPGEIKELGDKVRRLLAPYQAREWLPSTRPQEAAPVAVISRIFPIIPSAPGDRPAGE